MATRGLTNGWSVRCLAICLALAACCLGVLLLRAAAQSGSRKAETGHPPLCASGVCVMHPAEGEVLSIGTGRSYLQDYLAVTSAVATQCRYAERKVGYDRM